MMLRIFIFFLLAGAVVLAVFFIQSRPSLDFAVGTDGCSDKTSSKWINDEVLEVKYCEFLLHSAKLGHGTYSLDGNRLILKYIPGDSTYPKGAPAPRGGVTSNLIYRFSGLAKIDYEIVVER